MAGDTSAIESPVKQMSQLRTRIVLYDDIIRDYKQLIVALSEAGELFVRVMIYANTLDVSPVAWKKAFESIRDDYAEILTHMEGTLFTH